MAAAWQRVPGRELLEMERGFKFYNNNHRNILPSAGNSAAAMTIILPRVYMNSQASLTEILIIRKIFNNT